MAYLRRWRQCQAEVEALAAEDSDRDNDANVDDDVVSIPCLQEEVNSNNQSQDSGNIDNNIDDDIADVSTFTIGTEEDDNNSETDHSFNVTSGDEDSASDDDGMPHADLADSLRQWSSKHSCTRAALNDIIDIFRQQGHRLPKDSRTLLHTPRHVNSQDRCGGQYIYFGIESGLLRDIAQCQPNSEDLTIKINIDGVPLFKSTNVQFWPILCSMNNLEPYIVALFCGKTKPTPLIDFLNDFLQETQQLLDEGVMYNDKHYNISLSAFICDAPARAFLKCIKPHNAYYSCERCVIKGSWNGRVVFNSNGQQHDLRTTHGFNDLQYVDHQITRTPLLDIGVDCIHDFPLDYMHLVCLGVVKRLLSFLTRGPPNCRLSHRHKSLISERLISYNGLMPSEFARQPRSLTEVDRWKATEFRQFLLYTGPVALHDVISDEMYKHFLTLCIAISILLDDDDEKRQAYLPYSQQLLHHFVENSSEFYGETFVVYNVHHLTHIHEDVQHHGTSLNAISAFPFENHLQRIKKLVKKSQNPIAQVTKRLSEFESAQTKRVTKQCIRLVTAKRPMLPVS